MANHRLTGITNFVHLHYFAVTAGIVAALVVARYDSYGSDWKYRVLASERNQCPFCQESRGG